MADSLTFTKDEGYKMKNSSQGENLLRLHPIIDVHSNRIIFEVWYTIIKAEEKYLQNKWRQYDKAGTE